MKVRIALYDDVGLSYYSTSARAKIAIPRKDTHFFGKDEEFYNKLVEYAELLQCKDNEEKRGIK